jgi:hypothetical protein
MKTSTKLKVLRAVSGLFSWGWIIAALIGVYCLVAAIGFGGSWVKVFIAFGISGISKWLARGSIYNKKRLAFETEMISRGMTPEQAANAAARLLDR